MVATYVDLGPVEYEDPVDFIPDDDRDDIIEDEETDDLNPESAQFYDQLIKRIVVFCEELAGIEFRPYQTDLAYRIVESLVKIDTQDITALWARQSGKSETLSVVIAGCMVILPKLAFSFECLERFKRGLWVGMFAPVKDQSGIIHSRVVQKLTSDHALSMLHDPELDEKVDGKGGVVRLRNGSFARRQTANPRAQIEGDTYHLVVIDEAQNADDTVVRKSIHPMLAANAGSMVKIGTPSFHKGDFYRSIQMNKRRATGRRSKQNHFEYNWETVAKYNPLYGKFLKEEKIRLGEDSDEFQMCLAPDTRILTADLRHIPASEVIEGMELIGFDEHSPGKGLHRKLKPSVVESVLTVTRPSYRIHLDDGSSVVASTEHPWLVKTAGGRTVWKTTEDLTTNDKLFKITDVWDQLDLTYGRGYLAAAFDGEGCLSGAEPGNLSMLQFSQRENAMLTAVRGYLAEYGFKWWETIGGTNNDVVALHIAGGRAAIMKFLGQIRPQRLLGKVDTDRWGSIGRHDHADQDFRHPTVVSLEDIGEQELISFQTSTRTYIAEGLATHNSYNLKWMLDRGMLITEDELDMLGDPTMHLAKSWHKSRCVVGIDPARVRDSTVVTVCWVDWEHPDAAGYREHRILNWLEIQNTEWESQYYEIVDFLDNYSIAYVGVDAQGMGGPVAERLRRMMEHRCEVIGVSSDSATQSERWKHLISLLQRQMVTYPAHSKAKRTRAWRRFYQQMEDAEKLMKGQFMMIQAPEDERDSHDDFVDSLAIAVSMSLQDTVPMVETFDAPWR
jgi:hypothetical protein